jgi:hypothetical protein
MWNRIIRHFQIDDDDNDNDDNDDDDDDDTTVTVHYVFIHTKFWSENPKGGEDSGDLGVDGRIILKWKQGEKVWIVFLWLRTGTSGGLL